MIYLIIFICFLMICSFTINYYLISAITNLNKRLFNVEDNLVGGNYLNNTIDSDNKPKKLSEKKISIQDIESEAEDHLVRRKKALRYAEKLWLYGGYSQAMAKTEAFRIYKIK